MSNEDAASATSLRARTAEEIRALMGRRRTNASKLARDMGVSQMYVWRRLSGETAFDLDDLEKIAAVLGVGVVDLLPQSVLPAGKSNSLTHPRAAERLSETHPKSRIDVRGPARTSRVNRPSSRDLNRPPMARHSRAT